MRACFTFEYDDYASQDRLEPEMQRLFARAASLRHDAYAPYSKFKVGASLLLESGRIISGTNQENAVYPLGLCAERVALFQSAARYPNERICAMAVVAGSGDPLIPRPAPPCGSCRQVIAEYEARQASPIRLAFLGIDGRIIQLGTVRGLLPFGFSEDCL